MALKRTSQPAEGSSVKLSARALEAIDAEVARQNGGWTVRAKRATRASVIEEWAERARQAAVQF